MVLAVEQLDVEVDDREADQRAAWRPCSRMPFSIDGMYSRGMLPPLIASMKLMPWPRSPGVTLTLTSPNWPEPPDCFLWV